MDEKAERLQPLQQAGGRERRIRDQRWKDDEIGTIGDGVGHENSCSFLSGFLVCAVGAAPRRRETTSPIVSAGDLCRPSLHRQGVIASLASHRKVKGWAPDRRASVTPFAMATCRKR